MANATRRMALLAAGALTMALLVGVADPAHAAPTEPTVTVTPSTDLVDGQTVLVSGTGWSLNNQVAVAQCAPDPGNILPCNFPLQFVQVDGDGNFSVPYVASRVVNPFNGAPSYDCALAGCTITVLGDPFLPPQIRKRFPVQFTDVKVDPPSISGAPLTGLVDGQTVHVSGSGFRAQELVSYQQCPPRAGAADRCVSSPIVRTPSPSGDLAVDVPVDRITFDSSGTQVDCAVAACTIDITSVAGVHQLTLDFASPELTLAINEVATLVAGSNDVVARVTVSCDVATPVSLASAITQPGVDYRYALSGQQCSPGEPLVAFLPSRQRIDNTNNYTLGQVTVAVSAQAVRTLSLDPPPTLAVDRSQSIHLLDFGLVKAAVDVALADPANTELRAQVVAAIALRCAQDPTFRREFARAIIHGG